MSAAEASDFDIDTLSDRLRDDSAGYESIYDYYTDGSKIHPVHIVETIINQFGGPAEWTDDTTYMVDIDEAKETLPDYSEITDPIGFAYSCEKFLSAEVENPKVVPTGEQVNLQHIDTTLLGDVVEVDVVVNNVEKTGVPLQKEHKCLDPDCGGVFTSEQEYNQDEYPQCPCGSTNTQVIGVPEKTDETTMSVQSVVNPETWTDRKMKLVFHGDLARENYSVGEELTVQALVLDEPVSKDSDKTQMFLLGLDMDSYTDSQELEISESDIEDIQELSQTENLEQVMVDTIAPRMVGIDDMKRGALYALLSGLHSNADMRTRIHVLYLGDPETAKTSIQKWIRDNIPQTVFAAGGGSTEAGLTIGNVKDELTGGYMVKLGVLPQAHKGYALIDEIDGADTEDLKVLNNPLEDGFATKSSIAGAEVPAETVVIGAANPKNRVFDEYEPIHEQFGFPEDFISRFDLIYTPTQDDFTKEENDQIREEIFGGFCTDDEEQEEIDTELFAKYIQFARQIEPAFSRELQSYASAQTKDLDMNIGKRKTRSIGAIAIASARLHLRSEVTEYDVDVAIEVLTESLRQYVGERGEYDAKIDFGYPSEQQLSEREEVLQVVELLQHVGNIDLTKDEWMSRCVERGIDEDRAEHHIDKLTTEGRVYELKDEYYTN